MIDAVVTDRNALASRTPSELSMYLKASGWAVARRYEASAQWIKTVAGDQFEVLQPLDSAIRDYVTRVRDLIWVVAIVEERSELDVLAAISNVSMDVHSVRAFPADCPPGMISLEDGVQAFESLKNLVMAAAYSASVDNPKAVQPTRKPAQVLKLLRETHIGPSREGSFILSAHLPVPPRLGGPSRPAVLFDDDVASASAHSEPFERQVSLRLYEAVRAAREAANLATSNGLDAFTSAVSSGVSANLCEALVGLGGEAGTSFEISLLPAASRPLVTTIFPAVRFRREHLTVLSSAAQELRERAR